ncbi:MAG TPA: hypothetical protein VFU81_00995 [Thermomicrobiales bacterium]|nr:hypothetical protein [Thermomicrobiales bacterium]
MDSEQFDGFVRSLADARSRRALLRAVAAALAAPSVTGDATLAARPPTCLADGKKCKKSKASKCCSGICAKQGRKTKCQPAPFAHGCTNLSDSCAGVDVACPEFQSDSLLCFVDANDVPFCADLLAFSCGGCATDQECVAMLGDGAFCLACPDCGEFGTNTACVKPLA